MTVLQLSRELVEDLYPVPAIRLNCLKKTPPLLEVDVKMVTYCTLCTLIILLIFLFFLLKGRGGGLVDYFLLLAFWGVPKNTVLRWGVLEFCFFLKKHLPSPTLAVYIMNAD